MGKQCTNKAFVIYIYYIYSERKESAFETCVIYLYINIWVDLPAEALAFHEVHLHFQR